MTSLHDLTRVFGRIGLLSFGGPAAQIALMQKELTESRAWLTEAQFLRALSFCMLLPGPEAMQLATYCGWRLRGIPGGLIAGGLFVLPGALVIAALAALYWHFGETSILQALFLGVQATVVIIILQAILRLSAKALKNRVDRILAGLAFLALFALALPFPLVIAAAAIWGATRPIAPTETQNTKDALDLSASLRPTLIFAALWAAPLLLLALTSQDALLTIGIFFSKMSIVSFGGAYALLAYMAQEVVTAHHWLSMEQMMDALGLAETTPGPLILVTQFVGHLSGAAVNGWAGFLLAGLLTLWVTFVPCFLWIFAGAPLIDWLETRPRIARALAAISASIVGVIANLSIWFAMHLFFTKVNKIDFGPFHMPVPQLTSLSSPALTLCALAAVLLLWRKISLPITLAVCAACSLVLNLVFF